MKRLLALSIGALLLARGPAGGCAAEPARAASEAAATAVAPDAAAQRRELERQTSELRGLPFKKPVVYKEMDRAQLRQFLIAKVKEQYSEAELRDYGRTLAALGLIPEGTDLLEILLGMYGEQVAAFYDPDGKAMYTFRDLAWSGALHRMLLAHELTHVLQDQNFDLLKLPLKQKDNDDRSLAADALVEGDATVLMVRWYAEHADPSGMLSDLASMLGQDTATLRAAPPYLRDLLLFPYLQGQEFAGALFAAGGTEAVNQAFRHLPASTREVLHPDQYLRQRRDPVEVVLPAVRSAAWRRIGNNVLGEFGIRSLLQPALGILEARIAADGWCGDRYQVYERGERGPTGLIWQTAWETDDEAAEFEGDYRKFTAKRNLPASVLTRVRRVGNRVTIVQSSDSAFIDLAGDPAAR